MGQTLRMTFMTSGNKSKVITIPSPEIGVTAAQVDQLMDAVVSNSIFSSDSGDIIGKLKATVETSSSTPLNITLA